MNALKDSKVGAWALRPAGFGVIAWVDGKRDDLKIHTLCIIGWPKLSATLRIMEVPSPVATLFFPFLDASFMRARVQLTQE